MPAPLYSLQELNDLIPTLQKIAQDYFTKKDSHSRQHDFLLMQELLTESEKKRGIESYSPLEEEARDLEAELEAMEEDIKALKDLGGLLKELDSGWVDFEGLNEGEPVIWSWRYRERKVTHYRNKKNSPRQLIS